MSEEFFIDKSKNEEDIYKQILPQINSLISSNEPVISNLSNISAVLKEAFSKISWVGFYIAKGDALYLGPFQGKTACAVIKIGSGVCGTAAQKKETIIVENVEKFPGHIACDAGSKSEIVVPIIINDSTWGVLDLDSYNFSSFSGTDKVYLEQLVDLITKKLNLLDLHLS